jgi:hypothetical protein
MRTTAFLSAVTSAAWAARLIRAGRAASEGWRRTYDGHGQLLGESVHAAGTVYGGTKLVVTALWALRGFNHPTDIDKQTRLITNGAHRAVRNESVYYK